jgi:hypothetical protein
MSTGPARLDSAAETPMGRARIARGAPWSPLAAPGGVGQIGSRLDAGEARTASHASGRRVVPRGAPGAEANRALAQCSLGYKRSMCGLEGLPCRRGTAVRDGMQQDLLNLLNGDPGAQRALDIDPKLLETPERRQHGQVDHAPRLVIEARSAPRPSPCELGYRPLEGHKEVITLAQVRIDVLATENLRRR